MEKCIAKRIQNLRIERNYSQNELADKMGIARSTLANYEQGIREPSRKMVEALAKALNTTPAYLMGWSDKLLEYVAEEDKEFIKDVLENGVVDHTVRLDEKEEALKTLLNDFGFNITKFDDGDYMLSGSGATRITKEEFERLLSSTIEYLEFNTKKLYNEKMYGADGCTTISKK